MSRNVNVSNLEMFYNKKNKTNRVRECIFKASGGTNFEKFTTRRQPLWGLHGFNVGTGLPEKTLDTSLVKTSILVTRA